MSTDHEPTSASEEERDICEWCGEEFEVTQLVWCEETLVCTPCAEEHGLQLANFNDAMKEELRES